jgi:hypothetical protein
MKKTEGRKSRGTVPFSIQVVVYDGNLLYASAEMLTG